ncbi:MAG: hypothetical protein HC853_00725 [Anaerolineae bacterium]|nr:hypothetical protein [Anaerolineae bacterium]
MGKGLPLVALSNYWLGDHVRPTAFITSLRTAYEWHEPALFDGVPLALLALEFLAVPGGLFGGCIQAYLEPVFPWSLPDVPVDADLDFQRLRVNCQAMACLRGEDCWLWLADTLAVIAQQTGNRFLDPPMDDELPVGALAGDLDISAHSVRSLEREWREAQRLLHQLNRCVDWLTAEPERWLEVYELVLASLVTPRGRINRGEDG